MTGEDRQRLIEDLENLAASSLDPAKQDEILKTIELDCVTFRKNNYLSMGWPIRNQVKAWLQAIDLRGNGQKS